MQYLVVAKIPMPSGTVASANVSPDGDQIMVNTLSQNQSLSVCYKFLLKDARRREHASILEVFDIAIAPRRTLTRTACFGTGRWSDDGRIVAYKYNDGLNNKLSFYLRSKTGESFYRIKHGVEGREVFFGEPHRCYVVKKNGGDIVRIMKPDIFGRCRALGLSNPIVYTHLTRIEIIYTYPILIKVIDLIIEGIFNVKSPYTFSLYGDTGYLTDCERTSYQVDMKRLEFVEHKNPYRGVTSSFAKLKVAELTSISNCFYTSDAHFQIHGEREAIFVRDVWRNSSTPIANFNLSGRKVDFASVELSRNGATLAFLDLTDAGRADGTNHIVVACTEKECARREYSAALHATAALHAALSEVSTAVAQEYSLPEMVLDCFIAEDARIRMMKYIRDF